MLPCLFFCAQYKTICAKPGSFPWCAHFPSAVENTMTGFVCKRRFRTEVSKWRLEIYQNHQEEKRISTSRVQPTRGSAERATHTTCLIKDTLLRSRDTQAITVYVQKYELLLNTAWPVVTNRRMWRISRCFPSGFHCWCFDAFDYDIWKFSLLNLHKRQRVNFKMFLQV